MDVSFWEQTVRFGPLAAWAKSSRPLFQLEPTPSGFGCGSLDGATLSFTPSELHGCCNYTLYSTRLKTTRPKAV